MSDFGPKGTTNLSSGWGFGSKGKALSKKGENQKISLGHEVGGD